MDVNNQQRSSGGPGPLPNRWLHCPRKSESIIAEHFLAFKTPLSKAFASQMPIECTFTPEMMFDYCKVLNLKLGMWVDLTNTNRFYDRSIVEARGARYIKLQCRGHGETPSREQTQSFIEIVDEFMNERQFDIIGVHCTHGFNRTGFLIASYMVERMDYAVDTALAVFAKARPPGIYKQDYIDELFRRYEDDDRTILAPELPAWHMEYDDSDAGNSRNMSRKRRFDESAASTSSAINDNDDDEVEDDQSDEPNGTNGGKPRKRRRELVIKNPTFMQGVPGVSAVTDKAVVQNIQETVQKMCNWTSSGFPGAQPVSMDNQNLRLLAEYPYVVSWKADGTRYMMLVLEEDKIYFIDRNNSIFQVSNVRFVRRGNLNEHLTNTLLDGEMVLDNYNGTVTPRYLIYDILKIDGRDVAQEPFMPNRYKCITNEIIQPRLEAINRKLIDRGSEPFSIRKKEFWDLTMAAGLLSPKFAAQLCHEPDGLIFQPAKEPYTPGVWESVLKWKPLDMNSVDFRLKIVVEQGIGILTRKKALLFVGGYDAPYGELKYTASLKELDNKIVECVFNGKMWTFMRERTDKTLPNGYNTANKVFASIRNPVTKKILLDFIAYRRYREDNRMMPPPPPGHQRISSHPHHQASHQQQHLPPPPPPQQHQYQQQQQLQQHQQHQYRGNQPQQQEYHDQQQHHNQQQQERQEHEQHQSRQY